MYPKTSKTPSGQHPSEPKPCRSILKRTESPCSSKAVLHTTASGGGKSVKFIKSKSVQQAKLRSKLNCWLKEKGKTPSRYFNLMYFDEQLSVKKKRDKSLPGRMSEDLMEKQIKTLKKEEQNARKELFKGCQKTDVKKFTPIARRNSSSSNHQGVLPKKENTPRRSCNRRPFSFGAETKPFSDKSNRPQTSPDPSSSQKVSDTIPLNDSVNASSQSFMEEVSQEQSITERDIRENLMSMLQECLTLFRAGCPPDHILSWLENMEQHIPQTQTCASFYACKAEIFTSEPIKMLNIFCQAIEHKAEPGQVLTDAMKELLTPHFQHPEDMLASPFHHPRLCNDAEDEQNLEVGNEGSADNHRVDDLALAHGRFSSEVVAAEHEGSLKSKTPLKNDRLVNCSISPSFCDVPTSISRKRRSERHTPAKECNFIADGTPYLGSSIKYTVSAATPIPGQSPESVPKLLVTPVRRSTRLSHRQSTPYVQREIDSVWDLTLKEAETTMFSSNPAIEDS